MILGITAQAVFCSDATTTMPTHLRQSIHIPTLGVTFTRTVSEEHPRRTWRQAPAFRYDERDLFHAGAVEAAFRLPYDKRADAIWHLTGDLTLFQITDEEALELVSGTLPRNVSLRALRALDATGQTLLGAGRGTKTPSQYRGLALTMLTATTPDATTPVWDRITTDTRNIISDIEAKHAGALASRTPSEGRARGAGALHNKASWAAYRAACTGTPVPSSAASSEELFPSTPTPEPAPAALSPAPAAEATPKRRGVRPGDRLTAEDGKVYVARKIDTDDPHLSDVEMFRRAAESKMNVFLFGEPGTGKTRGLQAAFPDAIIIPITADTEVADLVGGYQPSGPDTFTWINGPLLTGVLEGRHVVLDEVGLMDPKVAAVTYPLMDGRGVLMVTANPLIGTVHAKSGFSISGTTNPNAPGVRLSEALLSRFHVHVEVGTDYKVARDLGCNERLVQAAEHLAKQYAAGEVGWAPQMRELLNARDNEAAFGLVFALRNLIASAPEMEREVIEVQLRERFGDLPGASRKIRSLKVD